VPSGEAQAYQISAGSELGEHVSHVGFGSLKVVREVFVSGKSWFAFAGQTVDFRDQEFLSRIERFIKPERGTDPHAFELACRLRFVS
jgi:hypothetical protein